jgi:Zn-dependent peptidase ImmA (M78 family)/transcriptional regulator with XRE-family HTH domain
MTFKTSAADAAMFFDGGRLTIARHLAGMRKSELAEGLHKSPTAISNWESGAKRPSGAAVAELSLLLGVDPSFFVAHGREVPVPSGPPHFRSLRSTSQLTRDQAVAFGQLAIDVASTLERYVEFPARDVPTYPVDGTELSQNGPEAAASVVREAWNIGAGPIRHLLRTAENRGVLVVFSPVQSSSVDAYSFDSTLRPVVLLNPTKRDYYRQRFDLAHELGHLVMHADAEPGSKMLEDQANRFASELLMPAEEIRDQLPRAMNSTAWANLGRLKEHWGVSLQALLFRSRWLGSLGDVSYRNAMATVSARGWRRQEPGQVSLLEQPSLLPRAVELMSDEGIEEARIAGECHVPMALFRTITSRTPLGVHEATTAVQLDTTSGSGGSVVPILPIGR